MEFEIVPYTRPINNQQPYLQIDDIVTFKTKNGEYLTIHPITKQLQLVVSKTVPNNGIFILSNSPVSVPFMSSKSSFEGFPVN